MLPRTAPARNAPVRARLQRQQAVPHGPGPKLARRAAGKAADDASKGGKADVTAKPEAAAAALAASVAFFRRVTKAKAPEAAPPALANVLPRQVVALLVALAVFVSTSPRRARREALLDEASNESSGNDVTEMSLLNTAEMWPEITSFIRTVLKETVEEAIQTRMPWFLSSLGFGRISFGDSALKVEELNVERLSQESYKDGEFRSFKVSSVVAWDADVDVALTAPFAAISAEHVLVKGRLDVCLQQILPRTGGEGSAALASGLG
eukprot:g12873.t1